MVDSVDVKDTPLGDGDEVKYGQDDNTDLLNNDSFISPSSQSSSNTLPGSSYRTAEGTAQAEMGELRSSVSKMSADVDRLTSERNRARRSLRIARTLLAERDTTDRQSEAGAEALRREIGSLEDRIAQLGESLAGVGQAGAELQAELRSQMSLRTGEGGSITDIPPGPLMGEVGRSVRIVTDWLDDIGREADWEDAERGFPEPVRELERVIGVLDNTPAETPKLRRFLRWVGLKLRNIRHKVIGFRDKVRARPGHKYEYIELDTLKSYVRSEADELESEIRSKYEDESKGSSWREALWEHLEWIKSKIRDNVGRAGNLTAVGGLAYFIYRLVTWIEEKLAQGGAALRKISGDANKQFSDLRKAAEEWGGGAALVIDIGSVGLLICLFALFVFIVVRVVW